VSGLYAHPCPVMVSHARKLVMRKVRKFPKIGTKALLSFPSIRLRGDSAEDTPKHQIPPLKTAEDYLMVLCHYADDRWGYALQRLAVQRRCRIHAGCLWCSRLTGRAVIAGGKTGRALEETVTK
jgi:hypothetical protein